MPQEVRRYIRYVGYKINTHVHCSTFSSNTSEMPSQIYFCSTAFKVNMISCEYLTQNWRALVHRVGSPSGPQWAPRRPGYYIVPNHPRVSRPSLGMRSPKVGGHWCGLWGHCVHKPGLAWRCQHRPDSPAAIPIPIPI